MMIVLTYDVEVTTKMGEKRLRKVARTCEKYGIRVQNSVFELLVDEAQYVNLREQIRVIIDKDTDSVRFYRLGNTWERKVETLGREPLVHQGDTLIL